MRQGRRSYSVESRGRARFEVDLLEVGLFMKRRIFWRRKRIRIVSYCVYHAWMAKQNKYVQW